MRPAEELGPVLAGRHLGEALRLRIEQLVADGEDVVVDFTGVAVVSPSFADEIFAKLPPDLAPHVRFDNMADDLRSLAHFVVAARQRRG
jgi:hypothetical protein